MVGIAEIEAAARRLEGVAVRTPLIRNHELDRIAGGTVLLKAENLQLTGSFKIRGAYNLMSRLSRQQAQNGVVAFSSGNHAQGVAAAGARLGIRTTIVMPEDAPRAKLENTKRLGGEIVTYDRYSEDRVAIATSLAAERGAALVPAYDHPDIIAGQGTAGLELADQSAAMGLEPEQLLVCCGGGGLTAGCAVAITSRRPGTAVYTVEPEAFDDTRRSLENGRREKVPTGARSICDALLADMPGEVTFEINRKLVAGGLAVSDDDARRALRFAFRELKLVLEPGGAVALAAVLAGKLPTEGRTTAVVLSGGNVDPDAYAEIQSGED